MNNIIQTIQHTARATAVLLIALLAAQTAWAWSGSGTSADPYKITSADDLAQLATNVNNGTDYTDMYFKQTANITLADAWTPIGTDSSHPFKGHYDGGGFTISGLTVSGSYQYAGLFGYITSYYDAPSSHDRAAELKNINIVDCNIDVYSAGSGNGKAGGIAGYVNCFNMSNCKVSGTIKGYDYAAGLIGQAGSFCTMNGCFADVTVSAHKTDPNAQNPPAYCLMGQYLNNMSASGNYYHNTAGVPVGISSATRLYAFTCLTDGLSMSQPTVSHGGKGYYATGANVTISYTGPEGYQLAVSYNDGSADQDVSPDNTGKYVITMPDKDITVSAVLTAIDWAEGCQGDANDPYMIYNKDQLDLLAQRVNGGNNYEGTYFKLGNDISYPHTSSWNEFTSDENNFVAIGSYYDGNARYFCGHFDGNNKTISGIRIYKGSNGDADKYQGIFGLTDSGADIHHLTLADARITGELYTGGIVGGNGGTVSCCHVADDVAVCAVQSNAYMHGGIVGVNYGGTIEQCTSAVTLTIADAVDICYGGIVGSHLSGTLRDNLAIGATVPAVGANTYGAIAGNNQSTLQRNYYAACKVAGVENATGVGNAKHDVTTNNGAVSIHTLTLAAGVTTATASTVTIGTTGYYAQGTAIALSYNGTFDDGYQLGIVSNDGSVSNAAVADGNGHYTAVMPAADATVTAHTPIDWATVSSGDDKDHPYMIYNKEQLDLLAQRVNDGTSDYKNKYFKLGADITYTHTTDWDDAECEQESNYEAIGGYYGSTARYFCGHFDGNNKTISGIRIYKGGSSNADWYQGIFGRTGNSADIHDLTLADARITGYKYTGGIVGYNNGGTVTRCHVTDDVAVCAVQSDANNHGGIVGINHGGTIEQCTSAATLTDANNSLYYGGIAGNNNISGGTLRDNLAIGATVPAVADNRYGAITGNNQSTLQRNYYAACKVANVENATGVGSKNADVTADDGAVPGYFLTFGDGITSSALSITIPEHKELNGNGQLVTVAAVTYNVAAAGTTVSFNSAETEGYSPLYSVNGSPVSGNSITMPAANVTVTSNGGTPIDLWGIDGGADGSSGHPYIITTTAGWNLLAGNVAAGKSYSDKYFQLGADGISISTMVGTSGHPFSGHFNGNGNTLTVDYANTDNNVMTAPFSYVDGATIQNLIVGGSITGSAYRAAGVIGETGTNKSYITNCVSSLTISSGRYTAGFSIGGNVEIEGCVFNGKINGTDRSGGFIGYSNSAQVIKNSLFAPKDGSSFSGGTFYYNGGGDVAPVNSYYTRALGTAQGKAAYVYIPATDGFVPANVGAEGTAYSVSGITVFESGLKCDGKFYLVKADVSLADNADNSGNITDGQVADVTLTGRTLYKDGKWNTLCLPFGMSELEGTPLAGATLMTLDTEKQNGFDTTGGTMYLSFKEATAIEAGVPYLVKWDKAEGYDVNPSEYDIVNPVFNGVTISSTAAQTVAAATDGMEAVQMVGTYSPVSVEAGDQSIMFLGTNNTLYYTTKGRDILSCRAYFAVPYIKDNAAAKVSAFTLNFNDEVTGITTTNFTNFANEAGAWYTLDGRKLSGKPTKKGMYINNGKKIVIE